MRDRRTGRIVGTTQPGSRVRALAGPMAWVAVAVLGATAVAADVEYNRDVRPILSENCFSCHGPDSGTRKADLRLDRRDDAVESGALAPGDAEASELVIRVLSADPDEIMPPPSAHKVLTPEQKDVLKRWVASGAAYQPHWSFLAPKRPEPPSATLEAWSRNPIDRFLLAKMGEKGLKPSPEADRRTLARRVCLDLTGLPPTPEMVREFVDDPAPDAYERFVDRLLASPDYGEHRARYWLDAARYADTHGIHYDNYREMWTYRQWVIEAFNANMPFDRFTVEQLAGDLLPNRTVDQQVASGFNRCNITTNEGGSIAEEYLVLYTRDRTETTSQVFMGLTTGCAVCHDHKFDPFSQKEFYELSAFFNNTTQNAMDGNVKDTPPIVFVPTAADRGRWAALTPEVEAASKKVEARRAEVRPAFDKWLAAATRDSLGVASSEKGQTLRARVDDRNTPADSAKAWTGEELVLTDAGNFEKDQSFSYGAWVRPGKAPINGALFARMDDKNDFRGWDLWTEGSKVLAHIIHKWPENAIKVTSDAVLPPGVWTHVLLTYDGSGKAEGVRIYVDGKARPTKPLADALTGSIRADVPFKVAQRNTTARVGDVLIHDVRLYDRALPAEEVERLCEVDRVLWLASLPADKRPAADLEAAFRYYLAHHDPVARDLAATLATLEKEQAEIKARGSVAHVMQEKPEDPMAYLLFRGDYDKRRDPVKPDTPKALPPMASDLPRNRLGLAKWLVSPEHPLTARVTVNRFWQELFGNGLVRTSGDFGITGELPSHPELLDWLAVEFRESGWDVKEFFKLMVTSAAYRQQAAATPESIEKDPQNRFMARGPRFRMDAEMVRDYALAVGGLLVKKVGGPSVRPYQPDGVWEAVAMPGSDTRNYRRDDGERLYRRSMYTLWKRAAPPASMDIFNAPAREVCTVRRERTNTPLQALVTLNDVQFVEAARHLAGLAIREGGDATEARIDALAQRLLARSFRTEELDVVRASLDGLLAHYRAHPDEAAKLVKFGESKVGPVADVPTLAAWTMLANELMNLDEVLNK